MRVSYFSFILLLESSISFSDVQSSKAEKILGGRLVKVGQLKYVVAVAYKLNSTSYEYPCAGSIIDDWHIVTVAHCFYMKKYQTFINKVFYIAVSLTELKNPSVSTRYIRIRFVVIPKYYDFNDLDTYSTRGDFAVVKLSEPLGLYLDHPAVDYIVVAQGVNKNLNMDFRVAGYGWHEIEINVPGSDDEILADVVSGRTDGKLRTIKAKMMSDENCMAAMKDRIALGNMCAKAIREKSDQPSGLCHGDSGAPLIHNRNYRLYGVAVNGFMKCDEEEMPGIYINLTFYREFIENVKILITTNEMLIMEIREVLPDQFMFRKVKKLM